MMLGKSAIKLLLEAYMDAKNIDYSQASMTENFHVKNVKSIQVV